MRLFDAHNHLQEPELGPEFGAIVGEALRLGLTGAAVNGTHEADWSKVVAMAGNFPWIRPQVGLHPWFVGSRSRDWKGPLEGLLRAGHGLGEVGLDRWMLEEAAPDDWRLAGLRRATIEEQEAVFSEQVGLAVTLDRPVTIHCLHAWSDLERVLSKTRMPRRGFLLHAFSGPEGMIPKFAEMGAYFSFNAVLLAPNRTRAAAAFRKIPSERILVETDAPSMPPPIEARPYALMGPGNHLLNHPANLKAAYEGLSGVLGIDPEGMSRTIEENFSRLFGRPGPVAPSGA